MADNSAPSSDKWRDGISAAVGDDRWNSWDNEVQLAVSEFNHHLIGNAGYRPLDWRIIKAMTWVESGANSSEWKKKPMQIGVAGDPGLSALLSAKEAGDLILPPAWKSRLTVASVRADRLHNIRAGVGYLLMRSARFEYRSVLDGDSRTFDVTVKAGDSLEKVAKAQGEYGRCAQKPESGSEYPALGSNLKVPKGIDRTSHHWLATDKLSHDCESL
ncbi:MULTISPECIES: peptidoglycan-binding protein [unclassified Caballeronia]|uniref:peptidoglycan-binding protein n=1 Tax=unclassified Caballeronia TaxID=2646786 RepID=UPI00286B9080|nr:peptidoglycan-binding protein [Caballeronia sp. LZ008]